MTVTPMPLRGRYRVEDPKVFLSVRDLPQRYRPCRVVRDQDMTLVAMHRGVPAVDVVMYLTHPGVLTKAELNVIRAAFGQPPVGQPADEESWGGYIGDEPLPDSLCLTAERALREEDTA